MPVDPAAYRRVTPAVLGRLPRVVAAAAAAATSAAPEAAPPKSPASIAGGD
jgi:hypothetical protein